MKLYTKEIPLEGKHITDIIRAINNANFLYRDYTIQEGFPTSNGSAGSKWNYINREIIDVLPEERFQVEIMCRGPWEFIGIYDKETGYLYTLMRESNLKSLIASPDTKLYHYLNALSRLNKDLDGQYDYIYEQLSFIPDVVYGQEGKEILDKILNELVKRINGKISRYGVICFICKDNRVSNISAIIPAVGMKLFAESNWSNYISPEYEMGVRPERTIETGNTGDILPKPRILRRKEKAKDSAK